MRTGVCECGRAQSPHLKNDTVMPGFRPHSTPQISSLLPQNPSTGRSNPEAEGRRRTWPPHGAHAGTELFREKTGLCRQSTGITALQQKGARRQKAALETPGTDQRQPSVGSHDCRDRTSRPTDMTRPNTVCQQSVYRMANTHFDFTLRYARGFFRDHVVFV